MRIRCVSHPPLAMSAAYLLRLVCVLAVVALLAACGSSGGNGGSDTDTPTAREDARAPDMTSPTCGSFDTDDIQSLTFGGDPHLSDQVLAWWPLIGPFVQSYKSVVVGTLGGRPIWLRNKEGRTLSAFTLFLDSLNTNWAVGLEVFDEHGVPCRWAVASLDPRLDPSYNPQADSAFDEPGSDPIAAYDLGVVVMTLGDGTADILTVEGGVPQSAASVGDASSEAFESQPGATSPEVFTGLMKVLRKHVSIRERDLRSERGVDLEADSYVTVRAG